VQLHSWDVVGNVSIRFIANFLQKTRKHFCFILSTGTRIRNDSVLRPRAQYKCFSYSYSYRIQQGKYFENRPTFARVMNNCIEFIDSLCSNELGTLNQTVQPNRTWKRTCRVNGNFTTKTTHFIRSKHAQIANLSLTRLVLSLNTWSMQWNSHE